MAIISLFRNHFPWDRRRADHRGADRRHAGLADKTLPVADYRSIDEAVAESLWGFKMGAVLLSIFGLLIAAVGGRVLSGMLYGISATDLRTFVEISLVLAFVALLASWLAGRRGTRVNPSIALRS